MIPEALKTVKARIATVAQQFERDPKQIQLLAVSKTRPVEDILIAYHCDQRCFGENYLQDAIPKIEALQCYPLEWHFIGALQSNKTRSIAEYFDWVHALDQLKHAQRLNVQRPADLPPLNVCIQVNLSGEPQKAGVSLEQLTPLAQAIVELPRLRLRGLMTLPAPSDDFKEQRQPFHTLRRVYQRLQQDLDCPLDTLSMGMTNDMAAAIAEGSTLVRIGTAIFGERIKKTTTLLD